jgi:hypothetical protein
MGDRMREKKLQAWCNGIETVFAYSEGDARKALHESTGEPCKGNHPEWGYECCDGDSGWSVVPPDKVWTVREYDGHNTKAQTIELWQAETGRGFLCSTEY